MTPNFRLWTCINYLIASVISLITILIGTRAEGIVQAELTTLVPGELPKTTLPKVSQPTCSVAYYECGAGKFCLGYWDIIDKCHAKYTNMEMIAKCQHFNETDFINDTSLFAPMTNAEKNITYVNFYCGICNFEKELFKFQFWTPWLFFKIDPNEFLGSRIKEIFISTKFTRPANSTEILQGLNVNVDNDSELISVFNETIYPCKVLRVVPNHLKACVELCTGYTFDKVPRTSSAVHTIRTSVSRHLSPNYPDPAPGGVKDLNQNHSSPNGTTFCSVENSSIESFCDYRDEFGDTCSVNEFLNDINSTCGADGYILWQSSQDGKVQAQCSNHSSREDHCYVCGPTKPNLYKKIKNSVLNVLDHMSIFFLFLYLALSTNQRNLRSLPKRIFYSYSVTLFAFYVFEFPLKYVKSCVIKYYVFFYIWQSHSFWILITAFDLWRLVYNSMKIQKVNVEGQNIRYLVYCILGWGLPALLLLALFPKLTEDQKSWSCPSVSGFENELTCTSSCELNKLTYYFGWVTIFIFLVLTPLLLIMTCVVVYLSTRNTARSSVNRAYTIVLLKVAMMMGLNWMLLVYTTWLGLGDRFGVVYEFISSFHGCFIFFAFGLEKNNLNRFKRVISRSGTEQTECTTMSRSTRGTSRIKKN